MNFMLPLKFASVGAVLGLAILCLMGCSRPDSHALRVTIAIPVEGRPSAGIPQLRNFPEDQMTHTEAHFHVLIENISRQPIYIFNEDNSEGYGALSLIITKSDGKQVTLGGDKSDVQTWLSNNITSQRLNPGESQVREVYYATEAAYQAVKHAPKPDWHRWGSFPFHSESDVVTIRAVFEQKHRNVVWQGVPMWSGKVKSEPVTVELVNR